MRQSTRTTATPPAVAVTAAAAPDPDYRSRRVKQLAEAHRRRQVLITAAPTAPAQLVNAIAATDSYWTEAETWREAIGRVTDDAAAASPAPERPRPVRITKAVEKSPTQMPAEQIDDGADEPGRRRFVFRRNKVLARPVTPAAPPSGETAGAAGDFAPEDFDIPPPGRSLMRIGRGRVWTTRLAMITAPLVLIGGLAYSSGVSSGSRRIATPAAITPDEAKTFHLSTFPADQAAGFGATYLTLCLTHPNPKDDAAMADRLTGLARMSSSGVSAGCGWDGTGTAQRPLSVSWTGIAPPAAGTYTTGGAAQLDYLVAMADGRTLGIALPVWVAASTDGSAMRIVGDISVLPVTNPVSAPVPVPPAVVDPDLAQTLSGSVLLPFLQAWARSDPVQLPLVLDSSASAVATQGLEGQLADPQIDTAQVVVDSGTPPNYRDGDRITAQVAVDWTAVTGGVQTVSYSISLRRTAGRWLVADISGGPVDAAGGAAPNTIFSSPPIPSTS